MYSLLQGNWPWYITGILFGLIVPLLLIVGNKPFGISKSLKDIASLFPQKKFSQLKHDLKPNYWRIYFIVGIIIGGYLAVLFLNGNATIDLSKSTINDLENIGITNFDGLVPSQIFNWEFLLSTQGLIIMILGGFLIFFFLFIYFVWFGYSIKEENDKAEGEKIKINPYDNLPLHRKMIDKKNQQIGAFDLGNHILIIGMIMFVVFVCLNVE